MTSNSATTHYFGYNLRGTYPGEDVDYLLKFAFDEGWANFYSMAAQAMAPVAGLADFTIDGANYNNNSAEASALSQTPGGEDEEAAVMKILWDLMDGANEPSDQVEIGMPALFEIIKNSGDQGGRTLNEVWRSLIEGSSETEQDAYGAIFEAANVTPVPLEIRINGVATNTIASSEVPLFVFRIPRGSEEYPEVGVIDVGRLLNKFDVRVQGTQGLAYSFSDDDEFVQLVDPASGEDPNIVGLLPNPTSWRTWLAAHVGESLEWTIFGWWSESPGTASYFRRSDQAIAVTQ